MFSKTCEYALRALVLIAKGSLNGDFVKQKDITLKLESPEAFTARVVQQLSKNNFVQAAKGPFGGYFIPVERMKKLYVIDIIKVFDGADTLNKCILGLSECPGKNPCAFHDKYVQIRERLNKELLNCSLYDVVVKNKSII